MERWWSMPAALAVARGKSASRQQSDKAGRECRGDDTADDIVNGGSILVLGAVDLERADLGSRGALGVLGDVSVQVPVMWAFLPKMSLSAQTSTSPSTVPSMVTVSPASAADLVEPRRATVLAYRVEAVGGAVGIEYDVLTDDRDAAINRRLGNAMVRAAKRTAPPTVQSRMERLSPAAVISRPMDASSKLRA